MASQETLQPASPDEIAMTPFLPAESRSTNVEDEDDDEEQEDDGWKRDSISFIKPKGLETGTVVTVKEVEHRHRKNSQAPTLVGDHTGIYWRTPAKMISFFFFGLVCSIAHHVYYSTRDGGLVPSQVDQQWALRFVDLLSFI